MHQLGSRPAPRSRTVTSLEVLVAAEDAALRTLLVDALREAGFPVAEAPGTAALIDRLQRPESLALCVVDAAALDRDSARELVALRVQHGDRTVPLLLLVAMADVDRDAHAALHAAATLGKPFGLEALRALVEKLIAGG